MQQIRNRVRSAYLKSLRAPKQLRDLQRAIGRFREHEPYGVNGGIERQNGQRDYVWRFQVHQALPDSFSLRGKCKALGPQASPNLRFRETRSTVSLTLRWRVSVVFAVPTQYTKANCADGGKLWKLRQAS